MTYIAYKEHKFASKTMAVIDKANEIINRYAAQGYTLTLRQLYYQFITINYFKNTEQSYNRLGETISNARLAGLISWDAITDNTRNISRIPNWDGPRDFLDSVVPQFHMDHWANQPNYVEVWVEKAALLGVIQRPCERKDVPYMACRGYMSQSEEWAAANRFEEAYHSGRDPILIYLGDHDPSGCDMSRDHQTRLDTFLDHLGFNVDVQRIALNIDQVHQYKPPPNPTKVLDSRSPEYVKKFGRECWELDALQPSVIDKLIRDNIDAYIDEELWTQRLEEIKEAKADLENIVQLGHDAVAEKKRQKDLDDSDEHH